MAGSKDQHYTGNPPNGALTISRLHVLNKRRAIVWMVFPSGTYEYEKTNGLPIKCQLGDDTVNTRSNGGPNPQLTVGHITYYSDPNYVCYGFGSAHNQSLKSAWGFENFWFALAYALRKKAERE